MKINKNLVIVIVVIIVLVLSLIKGGTYLKKGYLRVGQVASIEASLRNDSVSIYTKENNLNEIKDLVNAYNEAKLYDNSVGTTHDFRIEIKLTNGDNVTVAGGSQGFQTVLKGGKQFNIKGEKLWNYFKQQHKK